MLRPVNRQQVCNDNYMTKWYMTKYGSCNLP